MEMESPATELRRSVEQENNAARAEHSAYELVSGAVGRMVSEELSFEVRGKVARKAAVPLMRFCFVR